MLPAPLPPMVWSHAGFGLGGDIWGFFIEGKGFLSGQLGIDVLYAVIWEVVWVCTVNRVCIAV